MPALKRGQKANTGRKAFFTRLFIACTFSAVVITLCYYTLVDRTKRIVVPLLAAGLFTVLALFIIIFLTFPDVGTPPDLVMAMTVSIA